MSATELRHFELYGKHWYGENWWRRTDGCRLRFNGIELKPENEYENWGWICLDKPLETYEVYRPTSCKFKCYELRPEVNPTAKLKKRRTEQYFGKTWDDDNRKHPEEFPLYQPVYKEIPERWEPVEYTIKEIRSRVTPRIPPEGVKYDLCDMVAIPGGLRSDRPCYMPAQAAFNVVTEELKNNLPRHYKVSHRSFKSWLQLDTDNKLLPAIHIRMYDGDKPMEWETGWIPTIYADNLEHLQAQLNEMVEYYLSLMDVSQLVKCPLCGKGEVQAIEAKRRLKS